MASTDKPTKLKAPRVLVLITPAHKRFAQSLGLSERFMIELLKEDDWSFVIKLHALMETALTRALSNRYGAPPALAEHFAQSSMGGPAGKIILAYESDLITKQMRMYLERLGELRNGRVHSAEQIHFDFKSYVSCLEDKKRKQLAAAVVRHLGKEAAEKHLLEDPQSAFIMAGELVLSKLIHA